jgi:hypothetical protein
MKKVFKNRVELFNLIVQDGSFCSHFEDSKKSGLENRFVWSLDPNENFPNSNKKFMEKLGIFEKLGFLLKDKRASVIIDDGSLHISLKSEFEIASFDVPKVNKKRKVKNEKLMKAKSNTINEIRSIKPMRTNKILELSGKVVMNGNAEILVAHISGLEERIEKREDQLANMKHNQQFEFFNQLEVELWKTELLLLQGRLDVVRHQTKLNSLNNTDEV